MDHNSERNGNIENGSCNEIPSKRYGSLLHPRRLLQNSELQKTYGYRKKNNGFATLMFLQILFLVLALTFITYCGAQLMQIYLQRQKVCRVTSLKTMKNVAQQIDSLLSRNKKALSLRLQYKETEMELVAAAGYPPAVAALRARLALIKAQRIALDLWQKSKLAEINSTLFDGRRTIYSKIQKAKPQTTRPFLSYRTDDRSWAPQYILNDDYSNRLKLRTRFQIALNEIIPTENIPLSHFLGRHRLPKKMVFHCTATVESRSRKHAPTFWANE